LDILHEFLSQIGEIRYIRSAYIDENADTRGAYVEFSEQPSIPKVLSINGFLFFGRPLLYVEFDNYKNKKIKSFLFLNRVNHASSCVIKPATVRGLRSGKKELFSYKKIKFFFRIIFR
jgi:hypothetical protein